MNLFGEDLEPIKEEPALEVGDAPVLIENDPHPRFSKKCKGHDKQEQEILKLYNADKLPHALIFSGLKGIGKATFAYRLARFLLEQKISDPNQDSMFGAPEVPISLETPHDIMSGRLITARSHPDMLAIEREYDESKDRYKDNVDVASIRRVTPFLRRTSSEGGYRVVIIDDADTMNRSAQNGILKILEEPPARTIIILVAHSVGKLIPTIRSRARVMNFSPLSDATLSDLLEDKGHNVIGQKLQLLNAYSKGSLGLAMDFIQEGGLEIFEKTLAAHDEFRSGRNWVPIHKLSEELSKPGQDQNYHQFTDVMIFIYQTLMTVKARGQNLPSYLADTALQKYADGHSLLQLNKLFDDLYAHFQKTKNANLDKKQGVLGAFSLLSV